MQIYKCTDCGAIVIGNDQFACDACDSSEVILTNESFNPSLEDFRMYISDLNNK
jgi:ABC-type ATPase with predicted acetyltransferase domain